MPSRRIAWGPALLFLGLPLLAFPELIFDQQTLFETDLTWVHYPRHIFTAAEWLAGRVPLWSPYEDTGFPILAEPQVGVLYPFSLIFLSPFSPSLELSLFILIHFTLAAVFTYKLGRSLGMDQTGATIAGLAYGFGGVLMAQIPNLIIMTGAAWLPLMLYGVRRMLQQPRPRTMLLATAPITFQILVAQPQIIFYSLMIVTGYGLYHIGAGWLTHRETQSARREIFLLFGVLIAGILLAGPQLLPTFELQQLSIRSAGRGLNFLTNTSLQPVALVNLFWPSAFGNNVVGFKGGDPFQEVFIYIGLIPLVLTLLTLRVHQQREIRFFWLLLAASLLLALGRFTPLYQYVIQFLPGFSLFRIPARWLMGVNLAMAILAGFGWEVLRQQPPSRRETLLLALLTGLAALAVGLLWFFNNPLLVWCNNECGRLGQAFLQKGFQLDPVFAEERLFGGWFGLRIPAGLVLFNLAGLLIVTACLARRPRVEGQLRALIILFVVIDLMVAGGTTINPTESDQRWQALSGGAAYVLENVGQARVFPLSATTEAAAVSHLGQAFPSLYKVFSAGGFGSPLQLARYNEFLHEAHPVQAVQALGVRYLLTLGQMGADAAATFLWSIKMKPLTFMRTQPPCPES